MGMTESQFKRESERLQQDIREIKIDGLRADREKERLTAQTKWVKVDVAREHLAIARTDLTIAQEQGYQKRLTLDQTRLETQVIDVSIGSTRDKLQFATQERELNRQMIRQRLQLLDLSLSEAQFNNDDRRSEMRLKGQALPGLFSSPRLGG
ncbi:hypothetical protein H6G89_31890 [Oscillatoria sp. FACHB-1407]|uniref:hypothetical protein n=1 Tax=Oscillatoria sp. FACHB-1407 TaxID=2692847 RepID=UPI001681E00F|nr:hypothetical protein [Oscillatoria sp. FACHB-1407]MBD2465597.1 hypothetical protein [Oscillatoria sp. FACHB-1407]